MNHSESNMPEDAKLHENGVWYRELSVGGLEGITKLFNSSRPNRLEGETTVEYKIRRKLLKHRENTKYLFHNSTTNGTYINTNKKDKFKKK